MPTILALENHLHLFQSRDALREFATILAESFKRDEPTMVTHQEKVLAAFMSHAEVQSRLRKRTSPSVDAEEEKTSPEPLRITPKEAAKRLSCSPMQVYQLVRRGVFTRLTPDRRFGPGIRVYLSPEEVQIYAEEGELALRQYQQTRARKRKPR